MKTVKELHIGVRQGLQKVASNQNRNFLPEEIDLALNINQERFVKSKIRKTEVNTGFAIDQKQLDDIQELIVSDQVFKVENPTLSYGSVYLPFDYMDLISDQSRIYSDCNSDFTRSTIQGQEYIAILPFPNSTKTSNYYDTFKITVQDVTSKTLFDNSGYSKIYYTPDEKFYLINLVQEDINKYSEFGYKIYWENYRNLYKSNSFILVYSLPFTGSIVIDSSKTNPFTSFTNTINYFSITKSEKEVPNRLPVNTIVTTLQQDPYAKSNVHSVISRMSGDYLYVFFDSTFIITEVVIDYVRKPREISLSLNRMCELKESTHQELVDMTVQYLLLVTENPTYQAKLIDNKTNID